MGRQTDPRELTLAVDLGGTRIRAALVDGTGAIIERQSTETRRDQPAVDDLIDLARRVARGAAPAAGVVGVPGRVDYARSALVHAPHLPAEWTDRLTSVALSGELGIPIAVVNDADLAACGEAAFGAGAGRRDVVYVTISTGIGVGVVMAGRLVHGRYSIAEGGHAVIDIDATRRGEPATWDAIGSGMAMARDAAALGIDIAAGVHTLADHQDERGRELWRRLVEVACVGVANLAQNFSPEVVVVGGGIGRVGSRCSRPSAVICWRTAPGACPNRSTWWPGRWGMTPAWLGRRPGTGTRYRLIRWLDRQTAERRTKD